MSEIVKMWSELYGCTEGVRYDDKRDAERAVHVLSTCAPHHGTHHFAVIRDGHGVAFSPAGRECLLEAGLLAQEGSGTREPRPALDPTAQHHNSEKENE